MSIVIAAAALIGTLWQYRASLLDLRDTAPELLRSFATIDGLHQEVSWWRPLRRARHRRLVKQLLQQSTAEARDYCRVRRLLVGWGVLSAAAAMALVKEVIAAL